MKHCAKCDRDLPLMDFYGNAGHNSWCKVCTLAYQRARHAKLRQEGKLRSRSKHGGYVRPLVIPGAELDALTTRWGRS